MATEYRRRGRNILARGAGQPIMRYTTLLASLLALAACTARGGSRSAPPFTATATGDWINSPPLSLAALRGKVVLIEFWTFGCSNCRNTLPWLKAVESRYREQGLVVVGVHTPEFAQERVPANVKEAVRRLGITYPVMLDPDFEYWNRLEEPLLAGVLPRGSRRRVTATAIGELHEGESRGDRFEAQLRAALAAPP